MKSRVKHFILAVIILLLFCIPMIFWGDYYAVGGDDSKLYYLFPQQFLLNYTFNFIGNNQLGTIGNYFSQTYLSSFVGLIWLVKTFIPYNTQHIFFGLNISMSFFCFFLLISYWFPKKNLLSFAADILSSLLYTTSIFSYYTIWSHQLFPMYLASLFPLFLYIFIKSLVEKKVILIFVLALLSVLTSVVFYAVPWLAALAISCTPILLFYLLKYPQRFLAHGSLFVLLFIVLNAHWLFHMIYSPLSSTQSNDVVTDVTVGGNDASNITNIELVTRNNELYFPLLNLFHDSIQRDFSWTTLAVFDSSYAPLLAANILFIFSILTALIFISKKRVEQKIGAQLVLSWLLAVYLFTVKVNFWGLPLFLKLTQFVPGFVMFRNMFDKFGIAVALTFSLSAGMSFYTIVNSNLSSTKKRVYLTCIGLLVLANSLPFIRGDLFTVSYGNMNGTYNRIQTFNNDFIALIDYLKSLDTDSNIGWLPLNTANYIFIADANRKDHYYMGVSPLTFLTQKSDFAGLLSFKPVHGEHLFTALANQNYPAVGQILQKYNIQYIVLNNDMNTDIINSYFFFRNRPQDLFEYQNSNALRNTILGDPVRRFGDRYTVYEIADTFQSQKIYLQSNQKNNKTDQQPFIEYSKVSESEYDVVIHNPSEMSKLIFLSPYHDLWEVKTANSDVSISQHSVEHEYANSWQVSVDPNNQSKKIQLQIVFSPRKLFTTMILISTAAVIGVSTIIIYLVYRKHG